MYKIYKITANPVVDFAATELKKYLRMMMPRCGEITVEYKPDAKEGFRLGLMQDFGLDVSEAPDVELDDILHIDTDECGGIIAGDNPRSVLLAVYRYLTINGCRWLFAGIDGEYIPVKDIEPVKYHKMADCRYRGQCNEGAEYQPNMMEMIDFTPKIGLNIFMIEFDNPKAYYDFYYNHRYNEANREPEPVSKEEVLQWKRQCEAEIAKRGLEFHDMGHGWTADSFGIDSSGGWKRNATDEVPKEVEEFVALLNGKRRLYSNTPLNTQICMSNAEGRRRVVNSICSYAEKATNVDYLHVWLADGSKNHCECENCRKMIPSDWYVILMNELDAELTRRGLDTRIVFCCYVDTTWAAKTEKLNNPDRFSLLVGPFHRGYTESVDAELDLSTLQLTEYELNKSEFPKSINEYVAHARGWTDTQHIPFFMYEYHFWLVQYRDLGIFDSAKIIYNDIRGYRKHGCSGMIEDASQRSFFPNGFNFYVYASTLFDTSVKFEDLVENYFSHTYGEDWREVVAFFQKLGGLIDFRMLNSKLSVDKARGAMYNPSLAPNLRKVAPLVDEFMPFVEAHKNMPKRAQTVAYRILRRYLEYCKGLSYVFTLKVLGADLEAKLAHDKFLVDFGKYELEMERWYDHCLAARAVTPFMGEINFQMI